MTRIADWFDTESIYKNNALIVLNFISLPLVDDSTAGLALLQRNRANFFRRFVTMDETWVHYHTPEFNYTHLKIVRS
ncbi:hypothetical protein G5I_08103 [Acromyrmex echinatior]|uniref:Mariner Mos1 transposase n=1 Tax=Acromyrmex echinatior TaxID=103372 RepID=F4WQL3_ACREC|nr:hypothetical protein G5I_08103 [Acromyrmex echinatior]